MRRLNAIEAGSLAIKAGSLAIKAGSLVIEAGSLFDALPARRRAFGIDLLNEEIVH